MSFLLSSGAIDVIPDSVVSRDPDNNNSAGITDAVGLRIAVSQDWSRIGGELSSNVSGVTRAYVYRVSDGQLLGDADISSLTAGDTFTVDLDTALSAGDEANFVVDAEGASYTTGFDDNPSYPYTSSDGNLEIINGGWNQQDTTPNAFCILTVGNVGF